VIMSESHSLVFGTGNLRGTIYFNITVCSRLVNGVQRHGLVSGDTWEFLFRVVIGCQGVKALLQTTSKYEV